MRTITFPLKLQMKGPKVGHLQEALTALGYQIADAEKTEQRFGATTRRAGAAFQTKHQLEATGVVDQPTAERLTEAWQEVEHAKPVLIVKGTVRRWDGAAVPDAQVHAFDRDMRTEQLLGKTQTDQIGRYEIQYRRRQFRRADKHQADLIVRVVDGQGHERAASDTGFNAGPDQTIDVTIPEEKPQGESEFEQVVRELVPLVETVPLAELTDPDVEFLTNETGIPRERLEFIRFDAQRQQQAQLPAGVFYGLLRQGLPAEYYRLLAEKSARIEQALTASLQREIIPAALEQNLDRILKRLNELAVDAAFETDDQSSAPPLGVLLRTAPDISEDQQKQFVGFALGDDGNGDFWERLHQTAGFDDDAVKALQFTTGLGALTQHLPLLQRFNRERQQGRFAALRDLAGLTVGEWRGYVADTGAPPGTPGETDEEKALDYAVRMARDVERALPTSSVAYKLRRSERVEIPFKEGISGFLLTASGFDLERTRIDTFMMEHGAPEGIDDADGFRRELKRLQRVFKLAPEHERFEVMEVLLRNGLDSAHAVHRRGETAIVRELAEPLGSESRALEVVHRAGHMVAAVQFLFASYSPLFRTGSVAVTSDTRAASESSAELKTLFGSLSFCSCEHCHSVYSPAAYLVDLLHWLKQVPASGDYSNAFEVLSGRRPDIKGIELSCENTNTVLPYIDLVNEVLERAVAPLLFDFADDPALIRTMSDELDGGAVPDRIAGEFAGVGIDLSDNPEVTARTPGTEWIVRDNGRSYIVRSIGGEGVIGFAGVPQTRGAAEELRVRPEHVNARAYETLAAASYPWTLPFDLFAEEARVYLDHLGVPRHDLMRTFHTTGGDPQPIHIASEYLQLTTAERMMLTGETPPGEPPREPWALWGLAETGNRLPDLETPDVMESLSWIDALRRLPVFLAQSGMEFDELRTLLHATSVNSNGALAIEFPLPADEEEALSASSCDLEKARVTLPSGDAEAAEVLDRVHRFVRLQRKLAWPVRELDAALRALPPHDLTDSFLTQLAAVAELRKKLGVPLIQMVSWWADLETVDFGTEPSLYEQLFLDKAVSNPGVRVLRLGADRSELAETGHRIGEHSSDIAAALRIAEDELMSLVDTTLTDDALNLENLSALHRSVSLARALKLSIEDFLTLRAVVELDPFDGSDVPRALQLVETVERIRASGFTIVELGFLLRHRTVRDASPLPAQGEIALRADEIRGGLRKIADEHSFRDDTSEPAGELLREKLALLDWDPPLVERIIATLNESVTYRADLDPLSGVPAFPAALEGRVHYSPAAQELRFSGAMTADERAALMALVALPEGMAYGDAVRDLFNVPRNFLARHMRSFEVPHHAAHLTALPDGLEFPPELSNRIYHDAHARQVRFVGAMSDAEREILEGLVPFTESAYLLAIADLFTAAESFVPPPDERFLTTTDIAALFDVPSTAAARVELVLRKVMPYVRRRLSEHLLVERVGDALGLNSEIVEPLLKRWLTMPSDPSKTAIGAFLDPTFAESHPAVRPSPAAFPDLFDTFIRLHKAALVVSRLALSKEQLTWLFEYRPSVGWLDLNALPLTPADSPGSFEAWGRLADLVNLRDSRQFGAEALGKLLAEAHGVPPAATDAETNAAKERYIDVLTGWTRWPEADVTTLLGARGDHTQTGLLGATFPDDYTDERLPVRLSTCFRLLGRLGASAEQAARWRRPDVGPTEADGIRLAAKAKYDVERWRTIATPLQDALRERQRSALVAHLIAHGSSAEDAGTFEDAHDLFSHYLIDVDMSACMMTSRIKQANSSVQLFVQRCLMNLEADVTLPSQQARQWRTWMKNYRVWEANRKVFLYPENWIEPELRDDKSPFFRELEETLLQNEVREETVEQAYLTYLERLDEVARLEMAGMYHQKEDDLDILHVFGRTRNTPHIYYYRRWIDQSYWTPWERVDVDIQGDHLIPLVWNRRLYLFWPIFTEKAEDPGRVSSDDEGKPPRKYWEIQLAWSEHKNGNWAAKEISSVAAKQETFIFQGDDPPPADISFSETRQLYFFHANGDGETLWVQPKIYYSPNAWYSSRDSFEVTPCGRLVSIERDRERRLDTDERPHPPLRSRVEFMSFLEDMDLESNGFPSSHFVVRQQHPSYVLGVTVPISLLEATPSAFRILYPHQSEQFAAQVPFFYEDTGRSFFVQPTVRGTLLRTGGLRYELKYWFQSFYHPYACTFIEQLNRYGIDGLLAPASDEDAPSLSRQRVEHYYFGPESAPRESENRYRPLLQVSLPYPRDEVDFSYAGAYSQYNWELFFHAPLLIADALAKNQRFEEAIRWFHYIFDPTVGEDTSIPEEDRRSPARFWKIKPFFGNEQVDAYGHPYSIRFLLRLLHYDDTDPDLRELKREFEHQIAEWRDHPFNPHLIARLRVSPYQWAVVMKYLDTLIAWGDQLFRRDTIESINEATQLYVLAAQILGERPVRLPARPVAIHTYDELSDRVDAFGNALVDVENALAPLMEGSPGPGRGDGMPVLTTLYFCVPPNDKLLGYWDTVADRLFKIRHCMNIEGVVRRLPLFEPPIDPGLLVRAAAAGVDIGSVLSDRNAPLPHYRFQVVLQKALELCNHVKGLGGALLSALEKKDGEELALLRSQHELQLLNVARQIKQRQIEEAEESLQGLQRTRELTAIRRAYYERLLSQGLTRHEQQHLDKLSESHAWQIAAQVVELVGQTVPLMGEFDVGSSGWAASPVVKWRWGGLNLAASNQAHSKALSLLATLAGNESTMASIEGGFARRAEEWQLQVDVGTKELEQLDHQITAAEIRRAIAERDLQNHETQIEQAEAVDGFMRGKFTNRELYGWMVSQLAALYFQSYQLAYDVAMRAERAWQHELRLPESTFLQFGYWDSLKKGLLAGEKLHYDLTRMEIAYHDQNKREYELTKHVSLAMTNPEQLVRLRETGTCEFDIPELLFDLDFPGHYMRRIKSVAITIPCVTGPYTTVSATLTLLSNRVRRSTRVDGGYAYTLDDVNGDRFIHNPLGITSIATSSARNDSGMFELNFRDERFLPFEGAGAVSRLRLEVPVEFRQFDYDTISDAVVHLSYVARDGGDVFKSAVAAHTRHAVNNWLNELAESQTGLPLILSLRHDFSTGWHRFLRGPTEDGQHRVTVKLEDRFPYLVKDFGKTVRRTLVLVKLKDTADPTAADLRLYLGQSVPAAGDFVTVGPDALQYRRVLAMPFGGGSSNDWVFAALDSTFFGSENIEDVIVIFFYTIS